MAFRAPSVPKTILLVVVSVLVGVGVGVLVKVSKPESVERLWTSATLDTSGNAAIAEVIDYNFGAQSKHGIYRLIPGLDEGSQITVHSSDAPDSVQLNRTSAETEVRIGDPTITVTGQHRYELRYSLSTLSDMSGVSWNAAGLDWMVPIEDVEAHLVAPFAFDNVSCVQGPLGSNELCSAEQVEPGHLVIKNAASLDDHEGLTVYASKGAALATVPTAPPPPSERPTPSIVNPVIPGVAALIAFFLAAWLVGFLCRRAGREWVGAGGAADAAWADGTGQLHRIAKSELNTLAGIEFAPPKELTPARGGVLIAEQVRANHQASWLMQAAIDGYLDIDGSKSNIILRRKEEAQGYAKVILDEAFAGRDKVKLDEYDASFARAWTNISTELNGWRRLSGLWQSSADRRRTIVIVLAVIALIPGGGFAVLSSIGIAAYGLLLLIFLVPSVALLGAALSALAMANELRVMTAAGSGLWLRTESFRRFLEQCEAKHVEQAAKMGLLREYTAWAVALGESKRWTSAMNSASLPDDINRDSGYYNTSYYLAGAATSTSSAPSSSGGGGGGGFSGGGGGGGGGGSW